jgi:polysaccharide export outer membrane protein
MKVNLKNNFIFIVLTSLLFSSCANKKELIYLQGIDNQKSYEGSLRYEIKLQSDDLLSIVISAENAELTIPFNLPQVQGNIGASTMAARTFLIDNDGFIDYPILGKVKLGGLTRTEATTKLTELIANYITNPSVNMRILNYKISVLGEVLRPGNFQIVGERVTVFEALSLAGDIGVYGKRKNVLIIHDEEGKKTYTRLDITDPNTLNSSSYYLAQNDIVIVESNKTKLNSSVVGPNVTVWLTGTSILLTLLVLLKY